MIQRIQSLMLLGVVAIACALFMLPLSEKTATGTTGDAVAVHTLSITHISATNETGESQTVAATYLLMALNLGILVLAAVTISLYKNRPLQLRLSMMGGLLVMVQLILIFYYSEGMGTGTTKPHYLAGVYLVALQVLLFMAARRFIRRDEMLVRAADRIR